MNRKLVIITVAFVLLVPVVFVGGQPAVLTVSQDGFETRCGWFSNPTPANISLYDREDEWVIGVQGGDQAEGDWDWPKFKAGQWIKTNVNYGYGCACVRMRVNRQSGDVLEVKSATARTLAACRQDPALKKKWKESMFR